MKLAIFLFYLLSQSIFAQDPIAYLSNVESKIYSLKSKKVNEFTVEVESTRFTKQIKEQPIFGNVKNLIFKVYWTANPERLAIEVLGLPDGFLEIKTDLKNNIAPLIEEIIPRSFQQKFSGYKFQYDPKKMEITASDTTRMALVPTYILKFDTKDRLVEIIGKKFVGSFNQTFNYSSKDFSGGMVVLDQMTILNTESGQTVTVKKEYDYQKNQGLGVLAGIDLTIEQAQGASSKKVNSQKEKVIFKNYKINTNEAMTYFLGKGSKSKK